MPYIPQPERVDLKVTGRPRTPGQLNYAITALLNRYIADRHGVTYGTVNEIVGVLECAKLELYRRVAAPYEDRKCAENGDVY